MIQSAQLFGHYLPPNHRDWASAALKAIFAMESRESALAKAGTVAAEMESRKLLPARGHRGDDRLPFAGIPDGAPQEDPHEQHDRTAEPGDPASHARRRQFPGRQQRVDAHLRQNQVRHRERMEHAPLPRHVPAR